MANTLSVMLRNIVSKKRRRYTEGGFNLDLAYICHNIIAMGYPGEYIQSVFRNPMNDVCHFFEVTHPEHYKVYNLRSEKAYDVNKFHGRVSVYAFEDHNPPTIELIEKFCNDVHHWLNADPNNVAAIHCKAGKGRTGTMICCYLLYSGFKTTAEDALAYYGEKRTMNKKGVTIPSQRRYVQYYARLIQSKLKYERRTLQLCEIRFSPATILQNQGSVQCLISTMEEIDCTETRTSKVHDIDSAGSWTKVTVKELDKFTIDFRKTFTLELDDQYVFVTGDVKVELKKFFHFWFNSYFVCDTADYEGEGEDMKLIYTLPKWELDDAHKDKEHKLFSEDFKVQLVLKPFPPHCRNNIDGTEIAQLRQHNNHNNHVNSLTHNSHNNANMLLTHGTAIPTSSKSGDPTLDAYHNFIQHPVERSRKPTSLPPFSPLGGGGGIAGGSSHIPLNHMQNLMQRHHQQQQKRNSEPTPSINPESINRSNNKNHNNSSHHQQHQQQQQQQQQPLQHTHHHHHQHQLHHEQQKLLQQQQHQNQQQQLKSQQQQQQNNKCSTSSSNIHNTSSNSNSSSSSSISSQSTSSSSSAGVGGGGGGGGGGGIGEEEDWESGESSTTTTTTSTTTTTPTTTSYFPYKRLISSQNDDDDDNSNKTDKHIDDDDDDNDGVSLISTTKPSITTATITTTTTTTTTINNSSKHLPPITGDVNISENTNNYPPSPVCSHPSSSSVNTAQDDDVDDENGGIVSVTKGNNISASFPLPNPLPPAQTTTTSSTNGLHQAAYPSLYITPTTPIKPRHMNFFHRKCSSEAPCIDTSNQKPSSATTKCATAGNKFLKLINSQRFKAKTIGPSMGSSLALNSSGVVSASAVVQNQLLKKKKVKSKKIPPSKTFEWLHSYFQKDPDFHENLSQQTTIPMGRRNSAGSISSRNHLNSVGSASGIGRAGSVEKGFRVGSLESRGTPAMSEDDDEEDCHFVGLHGIGSKKLLEKSSGAVKKSVENLILKEYRITMPSDNTFAIEDAQRRKCNFSVEDTISMIKPVPAFKKPSSDLGLSLGTSPVDRALRNVVDVGTQLSSISPARDKEFTYESDSDHSMSQSNAAALLTKNNFRPAPPLDTSNCDEKSLDVVTCLPRVALGKSSSSPPSNERTTSIGSSNNSTSMDHLCVPYSNMYLQPQSTLDDGSGVGSGGGVDTEVYLDHDDYYSSICDNQLSFNNSPCKSPRSLSDILDLKPAITHRILLRQAEGSSPNTKATANVAVSAATGVANSRKNTTSSDGIVIAKPVESHSIGFNVELTSAMTSPSPPKATENYNMNVDCDDDDDVVDVKLTPARRKPPIDSILNLIIIKSDHKSFVGTGGGSDDVGDIYTDCGTGDVSLNRSHPKTGGSSSSSSGYCCASEGSQSVSSTSSGVVDTINSSGTAFSLERNSLDGGSSSVVVINSKKKLSLPTPEIEIAEFGMTKNRSSSVSNNNNHSNISTFLASPLLSSSSSSGSSIDNNDKH